MEGYIKCSDSWKLSKQLYYKMQEELKRAVQAHGGHYSWYSEDDEEFSDDAPVVMCNHRYAGPVDVKIKEVSINKYGCMEIEAVTDKEGDDISISFEDIVPGHLSFIIEAMPATAEVSDVSSLSTAAFLLQDVYLDVLQAITIETVRLVQQRTNESDSKCISLARQWTDEFLKQTTDCSDNCIKQFVKEKVNSYVR